MVAFALTRCSIGVQDLRTEDEDISAAAVVALRESGIKVQERFSTIESFEKIADGVRMNYSKTSWQIG